VTPLHNNPNPFPGMRQRAREIITLTHQSWQQGTALRSHWIWAGRTDTSPLHPSVAHRPSTVQDSVRNPRVQR